MKNRLRYLAQIIKMRLTKTALNRMLIFSSIVVLLGSIFVALIPSPPVNADANASFVYTDNRYSGIVNIYDGRRISFKKTNNTTYDGGRPQSVGCQMTIKVSHPGATRGTLSLSSCLDGGDSSRDISISKSVTYYVDWIDHSHIRLFDPTNPNDKGTIYYDNHIDDNLNFVAGQDNGCDANVIKNFPHSGGGDQRNSGGGAGSDNPATVTINKRISDTNTNCASATYPIVQFQHTENFAKYFVWVDSGTIQTSDGTAMIFVEGNDKGHYLDDGSGRSSDSKCKSGITADPNDPGHGILVLRNSDGNPFPTGFSPQISGADMHDSSGCEVSKRLTVNIAGTANAKKPPGSGNAGSGSSGGSGGGGDDVACSVGFDLGDLANSLNPLNWLMCGIVLGLSEFVQGLDDQINDMLAINTNQVFGKDGYERAWSKFRDIALGLLVVVSLIVVIAQALGMEIVDAYTIRKMLPRILIATLAIVLSWQLMKFAVNITNDLGWGIDKLISSSFSSQPTVFDNSNLKTLLVGLAGALGIAAVGLFGLMSFIGTAAIAVIITFLVLILRQVAVIMLMVFSPIAIIAYVLPNTQRVYKFWWESFSKMLLMFPMIVAFIAIAHVFSSIASHQSGAFLNEATNQVIAFIAYFGPYFAIPLTFRFAGSIMGTMGNAVNSRGESARGFLTKKRQEHRAQRVQRARAGKLWREGWGSFGGRLGVDKHGRPRSISRYANRAAMWGLDPDEMIPATIGAKGGPIGKTLFGNYAARAQDLIAQETMGHVTKAAQAAAASGPLHHKAERALAGTWGQPGRGGFSAGLQNSLRSAGFEDGRAPETSAQMQRMSEIMQQYGDTDEVSAASDLNNMAGFMGNLNKDPEMYRAGGNVQAVGALMLANSGRLGPDEQAQVLERVRTAGPHGDSLAARLEKHTSAASRQRAELRHGKGVYQDSKGRYHSSFANLDDPVAYKKAKDNLMTVKMPDLMGSKGETVDTYKPVWDRILGSGPAGKDTATGKAIWTNEQEVARAQVFQLASQYSSSDPDAKKKALDVIDSVRLREEFNAREMRYDPNRAPAPGEPPAPPTPDQQ